MSFRDVWQAQRHGMEGLASVGTIGLHMVSGPLVGVGLGYLLDWWLGTGPWLKLVFLFVGIGAGFLNVYIDTKGLISRLDKEAAQLPSASGLNLRRSAQEDESEDGEVQHDGRH